MEFSRKLLVEVWTDFVCPFCYIGKKRFMKALSRYEHAEDFHIKIRTFQLDPTFVLESAEEFDLKHNLMCKFDLSEKRVDELIFDITNMAKEEGLGYNLKSVIPFNTYDAHRIMHKAKEIGKDLLLEDRIFKGHFCEGKDYGKNEVLKADALETGLTEKDIAEALSDHRYTRKIAEDMSDGGNWGVTGVPFFVLNGKQIISGAQPEDVFYKTIEFVHKNWKKESDLN